MPTTDQLRSKLMSKLKELFQLNQPDLDFGFYRIMHAKAEQVSSFIDNDLLNVIQDSFGEHKDTNYARQMEDAKRKLKDSLGENVLDENGQLNDAFIAVPIAQNYLRDVERIKAQKESLGAEAEIYDHLYRFFDRYYDDGDFISRRYYTRETPGKAAPFSIPYNGEEVKLHWANADQYYIKTTEYFANYTVNLTEALKTLKTSKNLKKDQTETAFMDEKIPEGLKLHFRIIDATEGDHANVKASEASKRYFIIHKAKPVELNEKNELIINFEYRPDQAGAKQDALNNDALLSIINAVKKEPAMAAYYEYLSTSIPIDKDKDRILLTKYINQYTARNTMDYFIHKNLGAFLKRELDFYIKNEIMRLDDIENAEVPKVEDYLAKIKVLRKIAIKLIEFIAQLEDFQKKLWLKKKFVVETNYCITLDRVPEALYPQIIENKDQIDEWIKLYAIDEIEGDTTCPAYTNPLTLNFLKVNDKLMLDTRFFNDAFNTKLLSSIQGFDEQCDGLLIHSENFQALNLLQERYREQVKCIYIDPPYNSQFSEVLYKNEYKHASWVTLMADRLSYSLNLGKSNLVQVVAIDENEQERLGLLLSDIYTKQNIACITVVHNPGGTMGDNFAYTHEYAYFIYAKQGRQIGLEKRTETADIRSFMNTAKGNTTNYLRSSGANCFYPIYVKDNEIIGFGDVCDNDYHPSANVINDKGILEIYPVDNDGVERKWVFARQTVEGIFNDLEVRFNKGRNIYEVIRIKEHLNYKTVWSDKLYNAKIYGTQLLNSIIGLEGDVFGFPKSLYLVMNCIKAAINDEPSPLVIDFFAGSGTTGHAVINLNREDDGKRKYMLVEMGDYFDTVLKPRISKVAYCFDWKDGKPKNRDSGVSHCFKYLRLESYEDTLNNLVLQSEPIRDKTIADIASLQEDYLLHYMLDVESKGSQSLLNIDAFNDPTSYTLKVKKPGSDEYIEKAVDLIETFNYLIGLRLEHLGIPQTLTAAFTRLPDPELPEDHDTKLVIEGKGRLKTVHDGKWWIRKVEGWVPKNPYSPNDGLKEKVLIIWRKLTENLEQDNLILDTWFLENRINPKDYEFDTIYVNGSNNLSNLKIEGDTWKVRLIEEEFMKRMWEQS